MQFWANSGVPSLPCNRRFFKGESPWQYFRGKKHFFLYWTALRAGVRQLYFFHGRHKLGHSNQTMRPKYLSQRPPATVFTFRSRGSKTAHRCCYGFPLEDGVFTFKFGLQSTVQTIVAHEKKERPLATKEAAFFSQWPQPARRRDNYRRLRLFQAVWITR